MATQADRERLDVWAVILEPEANIDRHNRRRTVPMEVLSLGYSRTGTQSMQEALNTLAYPTYHFSRIFTNVPDADIWREAHDAKFKGKGTFDWIKCFDQVLGDYSAVTDVPCITFWRELLDAYPDAKIVLVERDEDKWFKSISLMYEGVLNPVARYVLRFTDPFWFGRISDAGTACIEAFTGSTDLAKAKENARRAYREHYASVRAAVPKDRLLEFELGRGWKPLCEFLGKDVPNAPFPHRNQAATMEMAFSAFMGKAVKNSLFNLAVVVVAGAIVGALIRRFGP